jgi:phage terminase large subunit-like protein
LDVSRKNGKSTLIAGMALYHLVRENEGGTEVDVVAMTRQQAKILFDMCSAISKRMDPSKKYIRQTINRVKYDRRDSFIQVLASESAALDGYSSSVYIIDECHNQKDSKLNDVLASSQSARENPLSIYITTAGYLLTGFYYVDVRPNLVGVLEGYVENDSLFGLIYTLDEKDDFRDPSVWKKAIPNLGVSVFDDYI